MLKYNEYSDENLVKMAQQGDVQGEECLIRRYKNLIRNKARAYFIIGSDSQDVIQEGMIGILRAIRTYDENNSTTFKTYAQLCINRQLISAIKAANRNKHIPLNTSVPFSKLIGGDKSDNQERTLEDTLREEKGLDPESTVFLEDIIRYISNNENSVFSDMEIEVWQSYLLGKTYKEIAEKLDTNLKAVYNAMERVKRKILEYFDA